MNALIATGIIRAARPIPLILRFCPAPEVMPSIATTKVAMVDMIRLRPRHHFPNDAMCKIPHALAAADLDFHIPRAGNFMPGHLASAAPDFMPQLAANDAIGK